MPLWNPYLASGYPHLSDPQVALFYPIWWLLLPLPLEITPRPFAFLHLLAAAWGAYRYARLDHDVLPAILCALLFAFGGVLVPHLYAGHAGMVPTIAFLPWSFLGARRIAEGRAREGVFLLGAATALSFLGGHLPTAGIVATGACLWALWHASNRDRRVALCAGSAVGLGMALAAVSILPATFEILRLNPRGGIAGYGFATAFSWEPSYWFTFLAPCLSACPMTRRFPVGRDIHEWAEMTCFLGPVPLLLMGAALRGKGRSAAVPALLLALVGIVLALGRYNLLYPLLSLVLPPILFFRAPARFLLFVAWGAALLAARGLSKWAHRPLASAACLVLSGAPLLYFSCHILADAVPLPVWTPQASADPHARVLLPDLPPNAASALRLRSPEGELNFVSFAYRARIRSPHRIDLRIDPADTEMLRVLGVRFVESWETAAIASWSGEIPNFAPRAVLFDRRGNPAGSIRWIEDAEDRIEMDVESSDEAHLRLADAWHPDWKAWVDGHAVAVHRIDGAFRGVRVPPGRHRITFAFRPLPLVAGALLSVLSAGFFLFQLPGVLRDAARRGASAS